MDLNALFKANATVAVAQTQSDIITGTLDTLNSGTLLGSSKKKGKTGSSLQAGMSQTYDLSKAVLSAAYQDKGSIINNIR